MKFIIIADKFQKRMKSKGCVGLMPFKNTCLFDYQYNTIRSIFPDCDIIYIYGFESKKFFNYCEKKDYKNTHFILNKDFSRYNHAYSLYLAAKYINDDCIIMFGDVIINGKTFETFNIKNGNQVFIASKNNNALGCIIDKNRIANISYGLDNNLYNIYFIDKKYSCVLNEIVNDAQYHNYFIFELINKMIEKKIQMYPYFLNNKNHKHQTGASYV